jgi:hypothetical protein
MVLNPCGAFYGGGGRPYFVFQDPTPSPKLPTGSFLPVPTNNLPFQNSWRQCRLATQETSRCPILQLNIAVNQSFPITPFIFRKIKTYDT